MELNVLFPLFLIIAFCVIITKPSSARQSQNEERLNTLEHFVRGEMYFIRQEVTADKEDRDKLMKRLNETLENLLDNVVANTINMTQVQPYTYVDARHLEKLTMKFGQNSDTIKEISESLIRYKRGLLEEKKARKSDTNELITQLKITEQNQNELIKNQNDQMKIHYDTLQNVIALMDAHNKTQRGQEDIVSQNNHILNEINILQNMSNELSLKTEALEKKVESQENKISSLRDSQSQLILSDSRTKELITDAHNVLSELKTDAAEIKRSLAPKLYCGNSLSLDSCLEMHFTNVYKSIVYSGNAVVRIVGNTW